MKAVRILCGDEWNLDHESLNEILRRDDVKDCPVAIYSINGPSRIGKSLLLNLLLFILRKMQENDSQTQSWDDVFTWRGGTDPCTTGMFINEEPVFVKTKKNEKVAVFFIDTEGFHDASRNSRTYNYKLFTSCSVISTFQMYNVHEIIRGDALDEITTFKATFEREVRQNDLTFNNALADLLFLVRDFADDDLTRGIQGGDQLLEELTEDYAHFSEPVWDLVTRKCYLFSYPGDKIDSTTNCDVLKDADAEFLKEAEGLARVFMQQLILQLDEGRLATGRDIIDQLMKLDLAWAGNEERILTRLQLQRKKIQEVFVKKIVPSYDNFSLRQKTKPDKFTLEDFENVLQQLSEYHERSRAEILEKVTADWPYKLDLENCKSLVANKLEEQFRKKEEDFLVTFIREAIDDWRKNNKSKWYKWFKCNTMRENYKIFGEDVLLALLRSVRNENNCEIFTANFKRDFKDTCNEELNRNYDGKKIVKIGGSIAVCACAAASLVFIPELLAVAVVAEASTAGVATGIATGLGAAGGTAGGLGSWQIVKRWLGERIYVEELNEDVTDNSTESSPLIN